MEIEIMCLQMLLAMGSGGRSTFELMTQRHRDHSMFVSRMTTVSTQRADTCAASCAGHPRCSLFKFDRLASLCTIFEAYEFRRFKARESSGQYYVYTKERCPVEDGYIFLTDVTN